VSSSPSSPSRRGLAGLAGVTTRPAGHPEVGPHHQLPRSLHLLTIRLGRA
jgi:hypothetical protein